MQYVYILLLTVILYNIIVYIDKKKYPNNENKNMNWVFLFFSIIISIIIVHLLFGSIIPNKNNLFGGSNEKLKDIIQEVEVGLPDF